MQDSQLGPMVSSIERFHCMQDSQLGPNGVLYREVPLYTSHVHRYTVELYVRGMPVGNTIRLI